MIAFSAITGVLCVMFSERAIQREIEHLAQSVEQLLSADLREPPQHDDMCSELLKVLRVLEGGRLRLRSCIGLISQSSKEFPGVSSSMNTLSSDMLICMEKQSDEVAWFAVALEEINVPVSDVAKNAETFNRSTEEVNQFALTSKDEMAMAMARARVTHSMQELNNRINCGRR
jgi:methyl-accepting chemotaxis protein